VTLEKHSFRRWKTRELTTALGLRIASAVGQQTAGARNHYLVGNLAFTPADAERLRRLFGTATNDFSAGLETNVEEIRSAVSAIPPSAISTELDWMKFARALAHEARTYKGQTGQIWGLLDTASAAAPGYDQFANRNRWLRYIGEAFDCDNPITIATVFDLAKKHGWQGWSPPTPAGFMAST
jgi:hypothetical protein